MDRATVDVYERVAVDYDARRRPGRASDAQAFGTRVCPGGLRADLGSGPGRYTAHLGAPVVALDAARAMLDLVPLRAPGALRVRADLEALPFRRGALAGAWANASSQHIARTALPLALARLHQALRPGAPLDVSLFSGDGEGPWPGDEFPGRTFVLWRPGDLRTLFEAAGFSVNATEVGEAMPTGARTLGIRATCLRTLPDVVGPGMRLLVCGLNPSLYAADAGVHYARPGNRFWPAALRAGLVSRARDPWHALATHGVGWTDLVKRASVGAAELSGAEYQAGAARLAWTVRLLQPGAICFVGLTGWRAAVDRHAVAGPQPGLFSGTRAYLMPSTSGLNAHTTADDLVGHLRAAMSLSDTTMSDTTMSDTAMSDTAMSDTTISVAGSSGTP